MDLKEKRINGDTIFEGHIFTVVKDKVICPNGNESFREIVKHDGGAGVLCVTSDDKVILIKQFRYAYDEVMYEIPAGKLEKGEDPKIAALREFEEETGNKAKDIELLNILYPTVGYCNEKIYIYLVKNFDVTSTNFDEDEFIETCYADFDAALNMIYDGTIKDGKTIVAILTYHAKYRK